NSLLEQILWVPLKTKSQMRSLIEYQNFFNFFYFHSVLIEQDTKKKRESSIFLKEKVPLIYLQLFSFLFKFCSTRKGTAKAAQTLVSDRNNYIVNERQRQELVSVAVSLRDAKLRELVGESGIGYHHAGMDMQDRRLIEQL